MGTGMVIGMGEVGKALYEVLSTAHPVFSFDIRNEQCWDWPSVDVLHVTFPCDNPKQFRSMVRAYQELCTPTYTVIHSTVHLGTTRGLGNYCYHSPVRGNHPYLAESLRTFTTYLAPTPDMFLTDYFQSAGMSIQPVDQPENTEAGKLWCLAAYATNIYLEKEIYAYCERHSLDFSVVYESFTRTYNEGYAKLGKPEVARPILQHSPGPIGGHCVLPAVTKLDLDIGIWTGDNPRRPQHFG